MIRKVFIGTQNIASQIPDWKKGFNANGVETMTAISEVNSVIISGEVDYNFSTMKRYWFGGLRPRSLQLKLQEYFRPNKRVWRKAIRECDAFMFIWDSFQPDKSDYKTLKEKGKKIITLFCGDDIRWYYAMKQHFSSEGHAPLEYPDYDYSLMHLESKLNYLRIAEKYSDIIVSVPDQSQMALRPYMFFSTIIDIESIKENTNQAQVPLIVHAPSNREIKGTKYILQAIEKLQANGIKFEFKLVENVSHAEALKYYEQADIVIGQLGGGLGKQGMEVLASGAVLLNGLHRMCVISDQYLEEIPAINIDKGNIFTVLSEIIPDLSKRKELAKKGRAFIEKYHNPVTMTKKILMALEKDSLKMDCDIYPTFFREQFIPESKESIQVYNKWTDTVKDCVWYKKYVKPGEHEGLKF